MRYKYYENAFNDNTEECFYFLGFLSADGCLRKSGEIAININKIDVDILKKLRTYLKTEKPITFIEKTNSCFFSFGNKNIYSNILKYGLTTNKSLTLKFPNNIPDDKLNHFIRGYFDGDGCVSIKKNKNSIRLRINFVGTKEFLEILQFKLIERIDLKKTNISNMTINKNTYQFNIQNKNDVNNMKNFLYYNSNFFLLRKKEKFETDIEFKIGENLKTKFKNVFFRKRTKTWGITYQNNGKRIEKSGFKTDLDAYNELKKIRDNKLILSPF
jgi:hypothetical protein